MLSKMKSSVSLTEELLGQNMESDLTRIILTVQSVVNIISNKLRSAHCDTSDQLVTWANQVWLDKLIKSRAVKMIITKMASSMLEVDIEYQGPDTVLVAFDPLTVGQGLDMVASSSFAVWRRGQSESEDEDQVVTVEAEAELSVIIEETDESIISSRSICSSRDDLSSCFDFYEVRS